MSKSSSQIRYIYYAFIALVAVPTCALSILGLFDSGLKSIGSAEGVILLICLIPIALYFYLSFEKLKQINFHSVTDNTYFPQELGITFYVCFLIFMVTILFSFNLIVTGFFLLNNQVPMGMDAVPEDAPSILGLSFYLLFSGILGSYYLVHSKRILRPKKTVY